MSVDDRLDRVVESIIGQQMADQVDYYRDQTSFEIDGTLGTLLMIAFIIFAVSSLLKSFGLLVQKSTPLAQPFADVAAESMRERQRQKTDDEDSELAELRKMLEKLEDTRRPHKEPKT